MKILKFGGSSVSSPENINKCVDIILKTKDVRAVVFSAFGNTTDQLIQMASFAAAGDEKYKQLLNELEKKHLDIAREIIPAEHQSKVIIELELRIKELEEILLGIYFIKESSLKTTDLIMSFGERLSNFIICEAIKLKTEAEYLDARKLVKTDDNYGNARVDFELTNKNIADYFKNHEQMQIVTGFIASTLDNITTTIGRGGSDLTASIFASAINASEIEIWTDVDGFLTADPTKVPDAFSIKNVTYEEAMELSHFGAKVIYPPTLQPALVKNVSIRVRNTFNPDFEGTIISKKPTKKESILTGITSISDIALLRLQGSGMVGVTGIASRLFGTLAKNHINVILITQASSEHTICFAIKPELADLAKKCIEDEFRIEMQSLQIDEVIIEKDMSIIAIVGEAMCRTPGIGAKIWTTLGDRRINVVATAQGSSELNISLVVAQYDEKKALNALHTRFFLDTKELDLYIVGTGVIGAELIEQIRGSKHMNKGINIKAIANSRKMVLGDVPMEDWRNALDQSDHKADMNELIRYMKQNYSNNVFVDCTASSDIIEHYEEIFKNGFSVVTPNKIANSGSYEFYKKLKDLSKNGQKFLYETNAGAGLPVIVLVRDIVETGDEIIKIEGVLSGTLSYIFNTFKDKKFSEVVKEAKEKGYTEPDPRNDLNGMDVARKILILAREAGIKMELKDVEVENLVPEKCRDTESVDEFFKLLEAVDDEFEHKRKNAENNGNVLRYIATFENGKAKVSLQEVGTDSPFYHLDGADNMVSFTTTRYKDRPLVVKGPGAGAKVTAAGVFADILKVI